MRRELRCGDEGIGGISDETPARFCFILDTDTFYFYDPIYDASAVLGTILTATRLEKFYTFMRVSNGENPKWRITSIRDKNGFHTAYGERTANDLFGKILSREKDDVYYIPPLPPNYSGLMLSVLKSNVEKKILEFLANLKNVETKKELQKLVWDLKYGASVSEWIDDSVNYSEKEDAGIAINEFPEITDVGTITDLTGDKFSFKTDADRIYLFSLSATGANHESKQIEAKRGPWFYTFNRIGDSDKWQIVSKILQK